MHKTNHCFNSPLRYPGGKAILANFFKTVLTNNGLLDGDYVELYAGGAGIAWSLLFEEYVQCIHINDLNKAVFSFWRSVIENTENLCRLIKDTPITIEVWHRQKEIQKDPENHSDIELGFSTFFLNRTNRSGIISGGVIGGKDQSGSWKLDARFNKTDLIFRIQRIARYASRIKLYNLDAAVFINKNLPDLPIRTLVYLDPPYYFKGRGLYEDHYTKDDHAEIANLVRTDIRQPWIISYDNVDEITQLYQDCQAINYDLSYSTQERYAGSEVMFFSDTVRVPNVVHPARVKLPLKAVPLF